MTATLEQFRAEMRSNGLNFIGALIADGKLRRFKAEGDNHRNSWYVLHPGPPCAAAFGCWKRGISETWCECNEHTSSSLLPKSDHRRAEIEAQRLKADGERQAKAKRTADWILKRATRVESHAYLKTKGISAVGEVFTFNGNLLLPLRDENGELHSLQFIFPDGAKRFLTGGRTKGCFFTISEVADLPIVICEGYATGVSIAQATGLAVIATMSAGNLLPVAMALRAKWSNRKIIIAGDNDVETEGNPGATKASEAARAIRGHLAIPQFPDDTNRSIDFNDLSGLKSPQAIKEQIEQAAEPTETDEEVVRRLADLPQLEYERQREDAAKVLGCRVSILDKQVKTYRLSSDSSNSLQGHSLRLAEPTPWPHSVNGADVLSAVAETFCRYIALPDKAADVLALWCAHAHSFRSFQFSPRLNICSPEKGCGKTTLRDVVSSMVPKPLLAENLTVAVLFRLIEACGPAILADEYDAWLRENEELRGLLNAGHRRNGAVYRCVGDENEVRQFEVFAPVVLCGIGSLPGTLHDRSIVIRLERAKLGELKQRFDSRHTQREIEICSKLARFCKDNAAAFESCDPKLPETAFNRIADNWRPLFSIAEIAGGDWPQRAAAAFSTLTSNHDSDAQSIRISLLADIQNIFNEKKVDRIFSKTLVSELCAMTDRPWPEAGRGGLPITETWLARNLRPFSILPKTLRIDPEQAKGYELVSFIEAFERYLPQCA